MFCEDGTGPNNEGGIASISSFSQLDLLIIGQTLSGLE